MELQTIQNENIKVAISPKGAELQSIRDSSGTEYLWQGDPAYWRGRATNLFPYIGRLTEGCYEYKGQRYNMGIHGFLRENEMSVEAATDSVVSFLLHETKETLEIYPFPFEIWIKYALDGNLINITFEVTNTGKDCMYFGIGGHPGFNVPLEDGLRFDDYYLEFAEKHVPVFVGISETCFPNGADREYPLKDDRILPLFHSMFDNDAIILRDMHRKVTLKSDIGKKSVTVAFPDMPYLGFWHTVKTTAPFVCIEPWSSLPSRDGVIEDIATQEDLISLEPGLRYINNWSIEIHS